MDQHADPRVTDTLTIHSRLQPLMCEIECRGPANERRDLGGVE